MSKPSKNRCTVCGYYIMPDETLCKGCRELGLVAVDETMSHDDVAKLVRRNRIAEALYKNFGNKAAAARELGFTPQTMYKYIAEDPLIQAIAKRLKDMELQIIIDSVRTGAVESVELFREIQNNPEMDPKDRMKAASNLIDILKNADKIAGKQDVEGQAESLTLNIKMPGTADNVKEIEEAHWSEKKVDLSGEPHTRPMDPYGETEDEEVDG